VLGVVSAESGLTRLANNISTRFKRERIRDLQKRKGHSQEDIISFGFSARHWQQIEAGRPVTVTTLLRICNTLHVSMGRLVKGLDRGIYER